MRRALCFMSGVVLLCLAGCTGTPSNTRPTSQPSQSSAPYSIRSSNPVELKCADAGEGNAPSGPGNLAIGGLTLEGLTVEDGNVPLAADVGLLTGGRAEHFRKSPAYLRISASPITVELLGRATGQALAWVPARNWTSGVSHDLRPWMTSKITLGGCPDRDVTYFGGLLANDPHACLNLRVQQAGNPEVSKRLRLDGTRC